MSRRDAVVKAFARGVGPDALDLTQYRQKSVEEIDIRLRRETVAGALGFAALDWKEDPEAVRTIHGAPLNPLLLRLKYLGGSRDKDLFNRAHLKFFRRVVGSDKRSSEVLWAVTLTVLFEWIHDACPDCRTAAERKPKTCPECHGGTRLVRGGLRTSCSRHPDGWGREALLSGAFRDEAWLERRVDCPTCEGHGVLAPKRKDQRLTACRRCKGRGRIYFDDVDRWRFVNDYLVSAERRRAALWEFNPVGRRPRVDGIDRKVFLARYVGKYRHFLDELHKVEKKLIEPLDVQVFRMENRDIVPQPQEHKMPEDELGEAAPNEPAVVAGELPPRES